MTPTQLIAQAIKQELAKRQAHLDTTPDLSSVTIVVKLQSADRLRSVEWSETRSLYRRAEHGERRFTQGDRRVSQED